jgi:TPR repeat protein
MLGCKNKTRENAIPTDYSIRSESELKKLTLQCGDIEAYNELIFAYVNYGSVLPCALIMANKYDYPQAYYDVYDCLWYLYDSPDMLDETTRKMAIEYLQKASLKGCLQARETLGEYYLNGIYFEKDTVIGKQLIKEAEKPFIQK